MREMPGTIMSVEANTAPAAIAVERRAVRVPAGDARAAAVQAEQALASRQHPDGYWCGDLVGD